MQINNNPAFDIVKELEYINRTVVPIDKAKKNYDNAKLQK